MVPLPGNLSGQAEDLSGQAESRIPAHVNNRARHRNSSKQKYAQPLQASQSLAFRVVSRSPVTEIIR